MNVFDTKTAQILERSLDASSLRNKVLANNISNVETPNFKRSDISFDDALQSYLSDNGSQMKGMVTDSRHIPIGISSLSQIRPEIVKEDSTSVNNNGNNVDIDSEMTQLATNQIKYNTLIEQLSGHFAKLRSAITGGR